MDEQKTTTIENLLNEADDIYLEYKEALEGNDDKDKGSKFYANTRKRHKEFCYYYYFVPLFMCASDGMYSRKAFSRYLHYINEDMKKDALRQKKRNILHNEKEFLKSIKSYINYLITDLGLNRSVYSSIGQDFIDRIKESLAIASKKEVERVYNLVDMRNKEKELDINDILLAIH
jgi:hypothetical protein